jgi:chromosome segregation ATPase
VNIIIAAVVGGIILLWGGIVGLLRMIDLFERKHILFLGAYTTLVAGSVMALVLFTNFERQKENRKELQTQMSEFSKRLNELSEKLFAQLDEKANLTASEFEIRARLQNEQKSHSRTRGDLDTKILEYEKLDQKFSKERATQREYQASINQQLDERFQQEEDRYKKIQIFLDVHKRSLQNAQKQLSAIQEDVSKINNQTIALQSSQNGILGKVNTNRQVIEQKTQELAQQTDALVRNQAAFQDGLVNLKTQVDSLYLWQKK